MTARSSQPRLLSRLFGLLLAAAAGTAAADPPRIGLVLGGGGARGAAHIGVLEVLERMRVPVHCVAGTSMGALVAGAWASGVSPERMRGELTVVDWSDLFLDSAEYRELGLRNKQLVRRFLPGSELGITPRGLTAPPGVVAGQKMKLFFNQLVRADLGEPDLARLPLPVALIATDIGNGDRVVFRSGPVTQAMRASMSVPGLLAPAEVDGRKLVDGGLVDNLPVEEVRRLCKPDVVIAVNVGSPLLPADEVGSLLTISAQMINILTEQNVQRSIAQLGPRDVYLRPALDGITAADFERHADAADRGRQAAEAQGTRLAELALPEPAYAAWRQRFAQAARVPPRVDAIEITGLERVHPEVVRRHIRQQSGEMLDTSRLGRDLVRVFGEGDFERVDYALVSDGTRNVLRVDPSEKRWGPHYLRLGLSLSSTLSQGASYSLRAAWHRTWLNAAGGELLATGELGNTNGLTLEWYQPLGQPMRGFIDSVARYRRQRLDLFASDDRIAEYVIETSGLRAGYGINISYLGQLQLGAHYTRWQASLSTGLPILEGRRAQHGGLYALLDLDRMNRRFFPTDGWSLRVELSDNSGDGSDYTRAALDWRMAWPLERWVIGSRVAWTGSPRGRLPVYDGGSLGGFLNLSAYSPNQVAGDSMQLLQLRGERVIGTLPLGLRGDLRVGTALELARIGGPFVPTRHTGWLHSLGAYIGGDTPIGPVYFGLAHSGSGVTNAYLFIGSP
ncbi:MAG: patatin-like phospholipase family protein [Rubrivivax sp.]|nr:patatin-like phospholipase family protein [Rubrivivax sp.]